ncbi:hypothetical protein D0T24_09815 [Duganella sp. BJB480]|uniref:hypothetical protein n=1 Tax=unclassified Duganella TaxID=2636909 RepID=UPI000E344DC2|nr:MULTISPECIES: hypothetical protein [unclassified Duganella]RFP26060.1 hypothetical protein D0T26_01435 [Duganella sp. BJB489]RFP36991.1 hypothetical protein D0T24_09815 [Duganella sp. BJB480]
MDILTYVESAPENSAASVIYYCIRALDQAGLPKEQQRDIFFDGPSNPATPEDIELTKTILAAIEEAEHMRLDDLDRKTAEAYIRNASDAMDTLIDRMEGYDEARGRELLRKMEAASLISL